MGLLDGYMQRAAEQEGSPVNRWETLAYNIECLLGEIRDGITADSQAAQVDPLDLPFVIQTDGTGFGQAEVNVRPGVALKLLGLAYQLPVGSALTGTLAFYRDQEVGSNLYKVVNLTALLADQSFIQGQQVPDQSRILVVVRGAAINTPISGRIWGTASLYGKPQHTTHS